MSDKKKVKKDLIAGSFALKIIERFGTKDVYEIAESAGVKIVSQRWYPVSFGEYERKTRTIFINRRACEDNENGADTFERKIVAHELGHFFAAEFNFDTKEEETFAAAFAETLIGAERV